MKKSSLVAAVLASMTLAAAVPAFAATNPFVDVPAKHWAYDSVAKLAAAGIVDGYGDGTFVGDKNMTRYEMAQIVAKSLTKYDNASAANKAIMDKLTKEFGDELKNLGVRVAALEKNQPNIKVTGESRLRFRSDDADTASIQGIHAFDMRQRLYLNAKISDKITYTSRIESTFVNGDNSAEDLEFNRNYFTVQDFMGADKMIIGRQGAYFGKNMNVGKSSNNDGIVLTEKMGEVTVTGFHLNEANNNEFSGIYASTNMGKNADIEIGYTKSELNDAKTFDIGASVQFGKGFSLVGEYVDSSNTGVTDGSAYAIQLTKGVKTTKIGSTTMGSNYVDMKKPHTSGFLLGYRNIEAHALAGNGAYGIFAGSAVNPVGFSDTNNVKGMIYGFQNVLAKNTILSLEYADLEQESTGNEINKTFTGSVQFWF